MRTYTLKGTMDAGVATRALIVDDGRYTHGFIIERFEIWGVGPSPAGFNTNAVLSFQEDAPPTMNADESGVFAWSSTINDTNNGITFWNAIDPQHVVNQDMYLHNVGASGFNYLIIMRDLTMTPDQGVLQLVKSTNAN